MVSLPRVPLLQRLRILSHEAALASSPLPSEPTLAEELGVSRSQLREALARLEYEGLLIRRPRSGTFVNGPAFGIQTWVGRQEPFIDILRRLGHDDARIELISLHLRQLDATEAEYFAQPEGCAALEVRKRWRAGGVVQMLSDYVVPVPGASTLTDIDGPEGPVFDLVGRIAGSVPAWEVANVRAAVLTDANAEHAEGPLGAPVLVLDLLGVDPSGRRLYRILEQHVGTSVDFGFVRTFGGA